MLPLLLFIGVLYDTLVRPPFPLKRLDQTEMVFTVQKVVRLRFDSPLVDPLFYVGHCLNVLLFFVFSGWNIKAIHRGNFC